MILYPHHHHYYYYLLRIHIYMQPFSHMRSVLESVIPFMKLSTILTNWPATTMAPLCILLVANFLNRWNNTNYDSSGKACIVQHTLHSHIHIHVSVCTIMIFISIKKINKHACLVAYTQIHTHG